MMSKRKNEETRTKKTLGRILNGPHIRLPPPHRLFVLEENEVNNLILGTLISQFLVFAGGILVNIEEHIKTAQDISLSTKWIGVAVSFVGFLIWTITVYRKLEQWKEEAYPRK